MKILKRTLFVAMLAVSLLAMRGTAWAWDGSDMPDPTGISWETTPGLF
jgi:hypothetical protein